MSGFEGKIPTAPEYGTIIYSNPFQATEYQLNDFEIDFDDFPLEENDENDEDLLPEQKEYEEKISKIQELIRLKKLEKDCQLKDRMVDERVKINDEMDSIKESINELNSYTTDLCHILLNYGNAKQDALYDKLNNIIYQDHLDLTEEDEDVRCDEIMKKLTSLKPEAPRKKRKH